VACTLCAFISLVWLREQILMNGGPEWLEPNPNDAAPQAAPVSRIQRITYSPDYKTYTSSIELMCRGTAICSNTVDTRFT